MAFTISRSPGKVLYVNNALFYMVLVFLSLDAVRCIMVTKKKPSKTSINAYFFFSRISYECNFPENRTINENKIQQVKGCTHSFVASRELQHMQEYAFAQQERKISWRYEQPLLSLENKKRHKYGGSM